MRLFLIQSVDVLELRLNGHWVSSHVANKDLMTGSGEMNLIKYVLLPSKNLLLFLPHRSEVSRPKALSEATPAFNYEMHQFVSACVTETKKL